MSDFQRKGEISSTNKIILDPAKSKVRTLSSNAKYAGDDSFSNRMRRIDDAIYKFRAASIINRLDYDILKLEQQVSNRERMIRNRPQHRVQQGFNNLLGKHTRISCKSSISDVSIASVDNVESRVERQTTNSDCDVVSHVNHSEVVCSDTTNALTDIHCDVSCSEVQVYSKDSVYVEPTLIDLDVMPDVHTYEDVIEFASCDIEPVDVQPSSLDADVDMEVELEKDLTSIWGSDIELVASSYVHNDVVSLESDYEFQHMQDGCNDISGITTCASVDTIDDRDHDLDVHECVPLECDMCPSMNASQVECMGGQATRVSASRVRSYGLCRERVPLSVSPLGAVRGSVLLAEEASVRVVPVLGARRIFDPGGYSGTQ